MPIRVELKSFYVEDNRLHITLEFPDHVQVVSETQAEAFPTPVNRQQILKCRNVSEVLYLLNNNGHKEKGKLIKSFQVSENDSGRRMTPRKIADLLFPVSRMSVKKADTIVSQPTSFREYSDTIKYYNAFVDSGVDETNYTQMVSSQIVFKFTSLPLFCSRGSEDEIEAELKRLNGIQPGISL